MSVKCPLIFHCTAQPTLETEPRSRNKLPPRARAEITNCGSGSFLFTTDLKKVFIEKKSWLLKKFLKIFTILILLLKQKRYYLKYLIKLSEAGATIQRCGSVEPEPKELFSAPQHCLLHLALFRWKTSQIYFGFNFFTCAF